ncbi:MAG: hypothetical protein AAF226_19260, partial [Verrucomicrobiota bacterium]
MRPFHSRNIGLSGSRQKVDIIGGAKVAGRLGKVGIGAMGTALDNSGNLNADQVGVARLTYDVLEESRVGTFFSFGDARGNNENWVGGVDLDLRTTNWNNSGNEMRLSLYELMSIDEEVPGHAFGGKISYPNKPLYVQGTFRQIDQDFRPGLGFVRRPGTRFASGNIDYEWLTTDSEVFRSVSLGTEPSIYTTLDNDIETIDWKVAEIEIELESGDDIEIGATWQREDLFAPFNIFKDLYIPAGSYVFPELSVTVDTSSHRPVSAEIEASFGEYWNGHRWQTEGELEWRQSKFFGVEVGGEFNHVTLPNGEFDVLIGFAGFRVTPNPKFSWNALAQWDNVSNEVGINSRIRYIVAPGKDIFFVINQGYL